jgi:hypothetical protein
MDTIALLETLLSCVGLPLAVFGVIVAAIFLFRLFQKKIHF